MLKHITRLGVVEVWIVAAILSAAAFLAFAPLPSIGTAMWLTALALIPPAIVLLLWPGAQPLTAAEVLRSDR